MLWGYFLMLAVILCVYTFEKAATFVATKSNILTEQGLIFHKLHSFHAWGHQPCSAQCAAIDSCKAFAIEKGGSHRMPAAGLLSCHLLERTNMSSGRTFNNYRIYEMLEEISPANTENINFCRNNCNASAMYMTSDDNGINYAHIFCDDNYVYTVMKDRWCKIVSKEQVSSVFQDLDGNNISAATAIKDGVLLIDDAGVSYFYKPAPPNGTSQMIKDEDHCMPESLNGSQIKYAANANPHFILLVSEQNETTCVAKAEFACGNSKRRRKRSGKGSGGDDGGSGKNKSRSGDGGNGSGKSNSGSGKGNNGSKGETGSGEGGSGSTTDGSISEFSTTSGGQTTFSQEKQQSYDDCMAIGENLTTNYKMATAIDRAGDRIYVFNETSGRPTPI